MTEPGVYPITIDARQTAIAQCEAGDFHAEARDVAGVPGVLADAAMHAIATGHTVDEHVSRNMTVRPVP